MSAGRPGDGGASQLELNLAALRSADLELAGRVAAARELPGAERLPTRDGDWTLRVSRPDGGATTLHSSYDPRREARRLVGEVDPRSATGFLVLGFGLGYHLQDLLEHCGPEAEILVLERDPAVLRAAAELRDLRRVLADRRVCWLVGLDRGEIYARLRERQQGLLSAELRLVAHAPSTALDPDYYQEARRAIRDFALSGTLVLANAFRLARDSVRNRLANLPLYAGESSLAELRELYSGRPGIVVSAGPSLGRNIGQLRAACGRAVLIACDVVLRPLLEMGVVPDFTAIVDFQGHTRKFFETLPERVETRLVAMPVAAHGTVAFYPGPRAFCGDELLDRLLGPAARPMGGCLGGGHVGHFAFQCAGALGLDPVAFVGQDLAFPHNITHLGGTPIHEEWQSERGRFFTLEMRELEHLLRRRGELLTIEDQAGNPVFTERSFYHYLRELELAIRAAPHRTVDCTEGGSRKAGAEIMPLAEFLAGLPEREMPAPGSGPRAPDRARLAAAAAVLDRRIMDFLEVRSAIDQKLRTHRRLEQALDADGEVDGYLATLGSMEERTARCPEIVATLEALTPGGLFAAARTDRELAASGTGGRERLRAQLQRDDRLLRQLADSADFLEPLLRAARQRCRELLEAAP